MNVLVASLCWCPSEVGYPLSWLQTPGAGVEKDAGDNLWLVMIFTEMAETLTHWGRVTHICIGKLTIIGSDNGLSPGRRQAIIWTNAGLLSIGPLRTYFSENLIKIQQFSLKKMHVKMSSAKCRPSCLGLNVLMLAVLILFFVHDM